MEKTERVNDDLVLTSRTDGLQFGTDALLLAAYIGDGYGRGVEYGAGTGIVSLLLLSRNKVSHIDAVEVQAAYAELTERNARENGLSDRLTVHAADLRELSFDGAELVFTNPPYMKATSGKQNESEHKRIARHEAFGTIEEFLLAARSHLKWGGDFFAVYRPDRTVDLIAAMRECGVEPKRLTFVHADAGAIPSMLLVEGKRGGKSGLHLTRPLLLYTDASHRDYTEDMRYILEKGYFPDDFQFGKKMTGKRG